MTGSKFTPALLVAIALLGGVVSGCTSPQSADLDAEKKARMEAEERARQAEARAAAAEERLRRAEGVLIKGKRR